MALIGIDLVSVNRMCALYQKHGQRFLNRILTKKEQAIFTIRRCSMQFLASRFAAKEAFSKAIGIGIRYPFRFNRIEVLPSKNGRPEINLIGPLREFFYQEKIWGSLQVAITDLPEFALAVVSVAERNEKILF